MKEAFFHHSSETEESMYLSNIFMLHFLFCNSAVKPKVLSECSLCCILLCLRWSGMQGVEDYAQEKGLGDGGRKGCHSILEAFWGRMRLLGRGGVTTELMEQKPQTPPFMMLALLQSLCVLRLKKSPPNYRSPRACQTRSAHEAGLYFPLAPRIKTNAHLP